MVLLVQFAGSVQALTNQRRAETEGPPESPITEFNSVQSMAIIEEMTQMIQREPTNASARIERARAWPQGKYDSAIQDLSAAIELQDQRTDCYFLRGLAELQSQQFTPAIQDFTAAIDLEPDSFDAHFQRAQAWLATNELSKSMDDVNRSIGLRPGCGRAYLLRGRVYQRQGHAKKFAQDYRFAGRLGVLPP